MFKFITLAMFTTVNAYNAFSNMPGGFGWARTNGLSGIYGSESHTNIHPNTPAYFREAELKHARVAMLAAVGFPIAEYWHPLFGGNIDVPSYISFQATPLQTFWPIVVGAIGLMESASSVSKFENPIHKPFTLKVDHESGDYAFDPLNLKPQNEIQLRKYIETELNVGRIAMLGIVGMVLQEEFTHANLFNMV